MINENLFPQLKVRTIVLDSTIEGDFIYDNPHLREDVLYKKDSKNKYFPVKLQKYSNETDNNLSVEVEISFDMQRKEENLFLEKDLLNRFFRIKAVLCRTVSDTTKIIENFDNISNVDILSLEKKGVVATADGYSDDIQIKIDDDESVSENILRLNFVIKDTEPEYLSLLVYSYFDIEEMEQELNLKLSDNKKLSSFSSGLVIENVINNGKVVSESFLFKDDNDSFYTGPISYDASNGVYYKYGTNQVVEGIRVPNTTVIDYRAIKESRSKMVSLEYMDSIIGKLQNDQVKTYNTEKSSYFTDLMLTQDEKLRAKMAFGIDVLEILKDKGKFGFLFKTKDSIRGQKILSLSPIKRISVYRNRVQELMRYNAVGSPIKDIEFYNNKRDYTLVCDGMEQEYGLFQINTKKDITGKNIGSLREMSVGFDTVRFFTAMDYKTEFITDGLYSYSVELEVEDGTVNFVKQIYEQTLEIKNSIDDLYERAGVFGNYDLQTGKLTKRFIKQIRRKRGEYIKSVVRFVTNLIIFLERVDDKLLPTMLDYINPHKATAQSILKVKEIIEAFASFLERNFVTDNRQRNLSRKYPYINQDFGNSDRSNVIAINKDFTEVFDSNQIKNKGLEFIEFSNDGEILGFDNDLGLSEVSREVYLSRANYETEKYFNSNNVDIDIGTSQRTYLSGDSTENMKYAFLTPTKYLFDKNRSEYITKVTAFDGQKNTAIEFSMISNIPIKQDKSDSSSKDEDFLKQRIQNISDTIGVKEFTNIDSDTKEIEAKKVLRSENITTDDKVVDKGDKRRRLKNTTDVYKSIASSYKERKSLTEIKTNSIKSVEEKMPHYYDLKSTKNALDSMNMSDQEIAKMPNQIKSLFMASVGNPMVSNNIIVKDGNIRSIKEDNASCFVNNYVNIVKVEALVGFDNTDELMMIKKPVWEPLSKELIEQSENNSIICRIKRYNSSLFDKNSKNAYQNLPIYNDYFVLKTNITKENVESVEEYNESLSKVVMEDLDKSEDSSLINTGVFII